MNRLALILVLFLFPVPRFLQSQPTILIAYYSQTGYTKMMAEAVAEGARSVPHVHVLLKSVLEATVDDLLSADAIIVGSPVYNANVAPQVQAFINRWPFDGAPLKNKIGAAFVTAGGMSAGEEIVQMNILQSMLIFRMIVVGGPEWTQAFGASAVVHEEPFNRSEGDIHPSFIQKGYALGERVAELAKSMKK